MNMIVKKFGHDILIKGSVKEPKLNAQNLDTLQALEEMIKIRNSNLSLDILNKEELEELIAHLSTCTS